MSTRYQQEYNMYIRLELAGTLDCPELWNGKEHRHAFWEILFAREGQCIVETDKREYELDKGQAVLLMPFESHVFRTQTENTSLVYVGFRCETDQESFSGNLERMIFRVEADCDQLLQTMEKIGETNLINSEDGYSIIKGLIPIVQWLQRQNSILDNHLNNQKNDLCMKTIRYIKSSINRFVSVEEIAESLYVTPHYLGMLFSSCMGMTILKYQQKVKLEKAAVMILQGENSIMEISDQLGYSSPQYFSKSFHEFYGFSPTAMKKRRQ